MFIIRLADLNIKINSSNPYLIHLCKDYIIDSTNFQIEISITQADLDFEKQYTTEIDNYNYLESVATLRKITDEIANFDGFLFHSCILKVDDYAYGFSAPSGTGKTTHSRLWKQYLKNKCVYINGDKPLIRIINDIPIAYGTPWNGKEGYGTNTKAPLKALAFIVRDTTNHLIALPKSAIAKPILKQIVLPTDLNKLDKVIKNVNKMLDYTSFYELHCNMDIEAAKIAYEKMQK